MRSSTVRRHIRVGGIAVGLVALLMVATEFSDENWGMVSSPKTAGSLWQFNVATGSVALILLVAVLSIRPVRALRGRSTPAHLPLRRAMGLWVALLVVAHIPGGLAIHTTGLRVWTAFESVVPGVTGRAIDEFTLGYWSGLAAAGLLVPLVLTSTDSALRRLGAERWRTLHRRLVWSVYWVTAVHVVALQYGESRDIRHVALTAAVFGFGLGARLVAVGLDRWHRPAVIPNPV